MARPRFNAALPVARPRTRCAAVPGEEEKTEEAKPTADARRNKPLPGSRVNLFDPAATLSRFLTRRFGIVGGACIPLGAHLPHDAPHALTTWRGLFFAGLGLVAVLALTEGTSIFNALREEGSNVDTDAAPVILPSGLIVRDLKIGGGAEPKAGDFVGFHLRVEAPSPDGAPLVLLDTQAAGGKPIAFLFTRTRGGIVCPGLEEGVAGMRRGGVRELILPPALGYRAGTTLPSGKMVPSPAPPLTMTVRLNEVTTYYN